MQCVWETLWRYRLGRRKRSQAWSLHPPSFELRGFACNKQHDFCKSTLILARVTEICQRQCLFFFHYSISLFPLQSLQLSAKASIAKDVT